MAFFSTIWAFWDPILLIYLFPAAHCLLFKHSTYVEGDGVTSVVLGVWVPRQNKPSKWNSSFVYDHGKSTDNYYLRSRFRYDWSFNWERSNCIYKIDITPIQKMRWTRQEMQRDTRTYNWEYIWCWLLQCRLSPTLSSGTHPDGSTYR